MGAAGSMCGWAICGAGDAESWRKAANKFIQGTLKKQLKKVKRKVEIYTGGGPIPLETQAGFNEIRDFLKEWDSFRAKEIPWSFNMPAVEGHIRQTIDYFDRAACYIDDPEGFNLNAVAEEIHAPDAVKRAPVVPDAGSAPDGGSWFRGGGGVGEPPVGEPSRGIGVIGWVALGAAGYFGFKVLTE